MNTEPNPPGPDSTVVLAVVACVCVLALSIVLLAIFAPDQMAAVIPVIVALSAAAIPGLLALRQAGETQAAVRDLTAQTRDLAAAQRAVTAPPEE